MDCGNRIPIVVGVAIVRTSDALTVMGVAVMRTSNTRGENSCVCVANTRKMGGFSRASRDRVNVFDIDDVYLFKHYFEGEHVFDRLKRYYNNQQYRFEVPPEAFESLQSFLSDNGYDLVVVESIEPYAVLVKQYTEHPDNIFKESVYQRRIAGYHCFVLTDRSAVERAVREGAIPLSETPIDPP